MPVNIVQLFKKTNCLEIPEKWKFCAMPFGWTNHIQHSDVVSPASLAFS